MNYHDRKRQRPQKEWYIHNQGVEYNGGDAIFTEVFDQPILLNTQNGTENVKRSMIYIISKVIDGRTFLKIGASKSTKSSTGGRLSDAQTFLLPGLEKIGFKVLYIFIYPYQTLTGEGYSENIEKALHTYLRNDAKYKWTVMQFATGNPSEWYLPEARGYKRFIEFILAYIGVQVPIPEASYHFFTEGRHSKPRRIADVVRVSSNAEILKFRHDYMKHKEEVRELNKTNANVKSQGVGNVGYFRERLLRPVNGQLPPLGDDIDILDVKYHRGATNQSEVHGQYYVKIARRKNAQIQHFTNDKGEEWTHISIVLTVMSDLGTLNDYRLTTNHSHYDKGPIMRAMDILKKYNSKDNVLFRKSDLSWLIGRVVIDKNENQFQATELVMNKTGNLVVAVKFKPDRGGGMKTAQPRVAMKMAIEYHQGVKTKDYAITDDYIDQTVKPKYKMGDFIQFDSHYFVDEETGNTLPEKSVAMVLKDAYRDFDSDTSKFDLFYDLLFEHELWFLNAKNVDDKSKKLGGGDRAKQTIIGFLANVTTHRNRIIDVLKQYNLPTRATRKRRTIRPLGNVTRKRG